MVGTIRVTSKRKGGASPQAEEIVVTIDRENPVLGNRHVLHDHRDGEERKRVIAAYKIDLDEDFARRGPKYLACVAVAKLVTSGANVALNCWCKQRRKEIPCHGDLLMDKIIGLTNPADGDPRRAKKSEEQLELLQ